MLYFVLPSTHQGTNVVLEDRLALKEDRAVAGPATPVENSTSAPPDYLLTLQNRFFHGVAETEER